MKRREFFEKTLLGGAVAHIGSSTREARAAVAQVIDSRPAEMLREGERVIERPIAGRPHADISASIDQKVEANRVNVTQGPAGENGARLRASLASQKKRLPILGNDDKTANRQYIKHIVLDVDSLALRGVPSDRELGRRYDVEWAEAFHYIGPTASRLDEFIGKNAVPL